MLMISLQIKIKPSACFLSQLFNMWSLFYYLDAHSVVTREEKLLLLALMDLTASDVNEKQPETKLIVDLTTS